MGRPDRARDPARRHRSIGPDGEACGQPVDEHNGSASIVAAADGVALLQLARCVRTHGMPAFPDPIVRNGVPQFPDRAPRVTSQAQKACQSIAARIPAQYISTQPVVSSDLVQLRVLARCIRTHGVPDWPDPNALGEFPIDTRLQSGSGATKLAVMSAARSCAHVNPDPTASLNVVASHP